MKYVIVGLAGFIGTILRYYTDLLFPFDLTVGQFPTSTFVVNMVGSFALGILTAYAAYSKCPKPFIVTATGTGLIGSFTTFSTFNIELVTYFQLGYLKVALLYIVLSIVGGIIVAVLGMQIVWKRGNRRVHL